MNVKHDVGAIADREGRYEFLKKHFSTYFSEAKSILDIGCDDNFLKSVYGQKVFGIDIGGAPDRVVDLEKESLRFLSDKSYEVSICTEVLEHIDNLHEVFADIQRVTSKYAIISIPNSISYHRLRKIYKTHKTGKFYGLPLIKPIDRHKWYFSYKEILSFFVGHEQGGKYEIDTIIYHYPIIYAHENRVLHQIKQKLMSSIVLFLGYKRHCDSVFVLLKIK